MYGSRKHTIAFLGSTTSIPTLKSEREGREKGGRREGEGREKGGRREGEGREKGGEGRGKGGGRERRKGRG